MRLCQRPTCMKKEKENGDLSGKRKKEKSVRGAGMLCMVMTCVFRQNKKRKRKRRRQGGWKKIGAGFGAWELFYNNCFFLNCLSNPLPSHGPPFFYISLTTVFRTKPLTPPPGLLVKSWTCFLLRQLMGVGAVV